jgi:hypothetical protein
MKIYGVMMVRNEADILRVNLLHHYASGIDRFIVVDNGSSDATPEILEEFNRAGLVDWRREEGKYRQAEITTDLAREAVAAGADWVLPIDADEFWCGVSESIPAVLSRADAGALRAQVLNFVQRRDQLRSSPEALLQMTMRAPLPVGPLEQVRSQVESGRFAYVEMMYQPKWISRAAPQLTIAMGNHHVSGVTGNLEETDQIVCLHAVLRSRDALEAKVEQGVRVAALGLPPTQGWHVQRWRRLAEEGRLDEEWRANSHEDGFLEVRGAPHPMVFDPRLRDVVRRWICPEEVDPHSDTEEARAIARSLHLQLLAARGREQDLIDAAASEVHIREHRIAELQAELFEKVGLRDREIRRLQSEMEAAVAQRDEMIRNLQAELHEKVEQRDREIARLQSNATGRRR